MFLLAWSSSSFPPSGPAARWNSTTKQQPTERFERDERVFLQPLAARPYRPLILIPAEPQAPTRVQGVPSVVVERRPLSAYSRIAGGAR